jgi:hypothetical protein
MPGLVKPSWLLERIRIRAAELTKPWVGVCVTMIGQSNQKFGLIFPCCKGLAASPLMRGCVKRIALQQPYLPNAVDALWVPWR